ncbi:MAG: hypothetical protein KDC05_03655, partial [Bacteroidales bacterium]|nr:hypothetical protein [Bacteroidales bacterium]
GLIREIKKEHQTLEKLVEEHQFDAVISDNRYGAYSENVPSVFMTHQLFIRTPAHIKVMEPVLFRMNHHYISRFRECWIPDLPGKENLSGELSHKKAVPANYHFIGPLSRFRGLSKEIHDIKYDLLALISGPEPQRSIFEEKILRDLEKSSIKAAILSGKPESMNHRRLNENIEIFSHLGTKELFALINESKLIVSRPGYSTLMDLMSVGAKAVFVPTPGQTEQEYLAEKMKSEGIFGFLSQREFSLKKAFEIASGFEGGTIKTTETDLKSRISIFLRNISKSK